MYLGDDIAGIQNPELPPKMRKVNLKSRAVCMSRLGM